MAFDSTIISQFFNDLTESIYTATITENENTLLNGMRIMREMIRSNTLDIENVSEDELSKCLWYAVFDQDQAFVHDLIVRAVVDVNRTIFGINMLWMSFIRDNIEITKLLIQAGANVNITMYENGGLSFLQILITMCQTFEMLELTMMVIEYGADVNYCTNGLSVLEVAMVQESIPLLHKLLQYGAMCGGIDIILRFVCCPRLSYLLPMLVGNIRDFEDQDLRIFESIQQLIQQPFVSLDHIATLLSFHCPVLRMNFDGWTLLRTATYHRKIEVVQLLLDYNEDVNEKYGFENPPLLWSAPHENWNRCYKLIVKYLARQPTIHEADFERIQACPKLSAYYEQCLEDLQEQQMIFDLR